jgi:hypothetical protein
MISATSSTIGNIIVNNHIENIFNVVELVLLSSGVLFYVGGAWVISISLITFYCISICLWEHINDDVKTYKSFPSLLEYKRLALSLASIYILLMVVYFYLFREQWKQSRDLLFYCHVVPVSLLSLFSIFYIVPLFVDKVWKIAVYCMAAPLLWSVLIRISYGTLIFVLAKGTPHFNEEVLSVNFYLGRYFETHATFITFLLLLISGIFRRFSQKNRLQPKQ